MKTLTLYLFAGVLLVIISGKASAELIINFTESSGNVLVDANGSLNIDALVYSDSFAYSSIFVDPSSAALSIGTQNSVTVDRYFLGSAGPNQFGPGLARISADSGAGDRIDVIGTGNGRRLLLPTGYTSGTLLSSSSIFNNSTFTSLGLSTGTTSIAWGIGGSADRVTVNIQATSVPEPSSFALFGAFALTGILVRKTRPARTIAAQE